MIALPASMPRFVDPAGRPPDPRRYAVYQGRWPPPSSSLPPLLACTDELDIAISICASRLPKPTFVVDRRFAVLVAAAWAIEQELIS